MNSSSSLRKEYDRFFCEFLLIQKKFQNRQKVNFQRNRLILLECLKILIDFRPIEHSFHPRFLILA